MRRRGAGRRARHRPRRRAVPGQLLQYVATVSHRRIPQRELRNNVAEVLRRAQSGDEFTITVRGRPVARLGPLLEQPERRVEVDRESLRALLAETPVDKGFAKDVAAMRAAEESVEDHWDAR